MGVIRPIPLFVWLPVWAYTALKVVLHYTARDRESKQYHGIPIPVLVALGLPAVVFLFEKYYWRSIDRTHGTKPAATYPHREPLGLGWLSRMSRALRDHQILQTWHTLFNTVGSTYWVHGAGTWVLMTNEPDNIKAVLSGQFWSWPIGGPRLQAIESAIGPGGIFSVNGDEWHQARALIRPSFVRDQIADLECTDRHVEKFLGRIVRDGGSVDVQELLYMFTMDVSTDFMFGYSTDTLEKPAAGAIEFTESFDYALVRASHRARLGWTSVLFPEPKLAEARKKCERFIDHHVHEALSGKQKQERPYVFMNEMIASGATPETIRGQLLSMILGGRDTSASTMSSLFYTLARRPDVVRKMRIELEGLEGKKPTWEEMKELKYVNNVLKETLRLWAPVATNLRMANEDTVLPKGGGPDGQSPLFVPKGTGCRWSLHSLHRRKDVFGEDADDFRPERWETLRTTWEYVPFSGGPRICIGQQFALTMMLYLVIRVFQTFEAIEATDDAPMEFEVGTTIKLVKGCQVRFEPVKC